MEEIDISNLNSHGYQLEGVLGEGAYGKCYLVNSKKYSMPFACKFISQKDISEKKLAKLKESWDNEKRALMEVFHPNILKIYDHWHDIKGMYIILEYCPGENMSTLIRKSRYLKTHTLVKYAKDILSAISYLHAIGIAHHDLKPSNFLFSTNGSLKVADFGLATYYEKDELCSQRKGTLLFMSPEMLAGKPHDPFKDDVWAIGVTLYNMAYGRLPWHYSNPEHLLECQYSAINFDIMRIHPKIKKIIARCLRPIPEERPTCSELLAEVNSFSEVINSNVNLPPLKLTSLQTVEARPGVFLYSLQSPSRLGQGGIGVIKRPQKHRPNFPSSR